MIGEESDPSVLLYGLVKPFAGALMQRLGVRRTTIIALTLLTAGVSLATLVRQPGQLVLRWGVVGSGSGMAALVLGATIVNRWFVARRGLAMGILTASTATGQLIFLPLLASVIERDGWRFGILIVASAAALMIPIVFARLRERPADLGITAYGGTAGAAPMAATANPARIAIDARADGLRSRDFWLLTLTFVICGASTNGLVGTHRIPAAHDHGIPRFARRAYSRSWASSTSPAPPRRVRSRIDGTADFCSRGTTGCAGCHCSSCRSPSADRVPRSGRSRCSTGSTGSPPCRPR
ncbi:MAG TPA: MFS transporter [Gemmatimonadaceae bacterium]|nr:MFS transporter [Gemmatimonadaceae bacterium]